MDASVAAILGAAVGSLTTLAAAVIAAVVRTHQERARQEHEARQNVARLQQEAAQNAAQRQHEREQDEARRHHERRQERRQEILRAIARVARAFARIQVETEFVAWYGSGGGGAGDAAQVGHLHENDAAMIRAYERAVRVHQPVLFAAVCLLGGYYPGGRARLTGLANEAAVIDAEVGAVLEADAQVAVEQFREVYRHVERFYNAWRQALVAAIEWADPE